MDIITKPYMAEEVRLRVSNLLRVRLQQQSLELRRQALESEVVSRTIELENYQLRLKETQLEVILRLAKAAEHHDEDTGHHTQRVAVTCTLLAQGLGIDQHRVSVLRDAAPLHDVGKIGIPDSILLKPGKFTDAEYQVMKRHCAIGDDLLSNGQSDLVRAAQLIALNHHEKWDGSGYPHGRQGKEIPIEARILAIADVFDALTHERPYKRTWPVDEAVNEIRAQSGRHFDPQLVEIFLSLPHRDLL
jgi:putative two-component system response regulator